MQYSPRSINAQLLLKRTYNDIDIVVEDTANRNMWVFFLQAHLPPGVRLGSITLAGGRDAVENACANNQVNGSQKKLYIVDGDYDFLVGRRKKKLKHLYRLRAMNIENFLIKGSVIADIAMESSPTLSAVEIDRSLSVSSMMAAIAPSLIPLFVVYAVSEVLGAGLPTTSYGVFRLCNNTRRGMRLDASLVRRRRLGLLRQLLARFPSSQVRAQLAQVQSYGARLNLAQSVSGKDYLLPILFDAFKSRFAYRGSMESFKVALARHMVVGADPYLKRRFALILGRP